nr:MAG TPA: hypothetical protein [Inoviridae sp.]
MVEAIVKNFYAKIYNLKFCKRNKLSRVVRLTFS